MEGKSDIPMQDPKYRFGIVRPLSRIENLGKGSLVDVDFIHRIQLSHMEAFSFQGMDSQCRFLRTIAHHRIFKGIVTLLIGKGNSHNRKLSLYCLM